MGATLPNRAPLPPAPLHTSQHAAAMGRLAPASLPPA